MLAEAVVVGLAGALVAFAANAISPRGLVLARNYFPGGTNGLVAAPIITQPASVEAAMNPTNGPAPEVRINEKGLQMIGSNRVARFFGEARANPGKVIFVDARNPDEFRQSHIPGATEFNPYEPEKRLAEVLPMCQAADQIVVYCTGGDCEDSQFAAILLRDAGTPISKLFVYTGGITEWTSNSLPVETGDSPPAAGNRSP